MVVKKPSPDLPIYCVQPEGGGKQKILHRNMLFPIGSASPLPDQNKTPKIVKSTPTIPSNAIVPVPPIIDTYSNSDSDDDYEQTQPTVDDHVNPINAPSANLPSSHGPHDSSVSHKIVPPVMRAKPKSSEVALSVPNVTPLQMGRAP